MPPIVLTVDELGALDRIIGLALPRFVTEDDEADLRVDAAAIRGLAARGLVTIDESDAADPITLSPALARLLAPCRDATAVAELVLETGGVTARHALFAAGGAPTTHYREQPAGLVLVDVTTRPFADEVRELCRLDELARDGSGSFGVTADAHAPAKVIAGDSGRSLAFGVTADAHAPAKVMAGDSRGSLAFGVTADAHIRADDRLGAGDPAGAVAILVAAGAPAEAARGWADAVSGRRIAVTLTVAGRHRAAELRWLVAADGTPWRIAAGLTAAVPLGQGGDWADEELAVHSEVSRVDGDTIRSTVDDLIGAVT